MSETEPFILIESAGDLIGIAYLIVIGYLLTALVYGLVGAAMYVTFMVRSTEAGLIRKHLGLATVKMLVVWPWEGLRIVFSDTSEVRRNGWMWRPVFALPCRYSE